MCGFHQLCSELLAAFLDATFSVPHSTTKISAFAWSLPYWDRDVLPQACHIEPTDHVSMVERAAASQYHSW